MQVELALLGPMDVAWDGKTVALGSAAARALIAYLALEPERAHARERLAGMMWPESSQSAAFMSLRQVLVRTRQALPEPAYTSILEVTQHTLRFRAESATVDVWHFEELVASCSTHAHADLTACSACIARMEQAAALYRGELLPGMFLKSSQPWEEWLFFKRETLHRKALFVLHTLTQAAEVTADYAAMRRYAQRQVELEPWREEAYRQVMRALAFGDERSAALATYEICRRVLDQELGIEPAAETTDLRDQIRDGFLHAPQPAAVPIVNPQSIPLLPTPPTRLIGRAEEMVLVLERLRDPACRMVTLTGPGGVGKTHLALEVSHMIASSFDDGVVFVALGAVTSANLVVPAIAHALGVHTLLGQTALDSLESALQDKRLLLVLDNFEHVAAASSSIGELLAYAPALTLLVTSRAPLRVRGENEIAVPPLMLPTAGVASDNVMDYPAIALFVQRAQAMSPSFVLTKTNTAAVVDICTHLDGLPLAIELAAARVKMLPPPLLVHRLSRRLDLLTNGMTDLPARHQALRSTIDWSYNLLGAYEQRLFARLAIFVGGCTVDAAETICAEPGDGPITVLDGLQYLVDNSLLRQTEGDNDNPRFVMLETIREYAVERLRASDEADVLQAKHRAYFVGLTEEAAPELAGGADQIAWFGRIGAELDNIRVVLRWGAEHDDAGIMLRIGVALREFWMTRAHLIEGRRWLETALELDNNQSPDVDDVLRGNALTTAGWMAANGRDYVGAELLFDRSLILARRTEDPQQIIAVLGVMGQAARMQGDSQKALHLYEESVSLSRIEGDTRGVAWGLCNLGIIAHGARETARAAAFLHEGVLAAETTGDLICRAWCLTFLARIAKDRGDHEHSVDLFEETLLLFRDVGHTDGIAFTLEGCAGFYLTTGDMRSAACLFGAAEALRDAINRPQSPYVQDLDPDDVRQTSLLWRTAWAEGRRLSVEQAIAYVIEQNAHARTYS